MFPLSFHYPVRTKRRIVHVFDRRWRINYFTTIREKITGKRCEKDKEFLLGKI